MRRGGRSLHDFIMREAASTGQLKREAVLTLALNGEYFDQIKAGAKLEEYRLVKPYWAKKLAERSYSRIVLTRGYPAADDAERRLERPWRGYVVKTITHPHFGPDPVEVFAINVAPAPLAPTNMDTSGQSGGEG